MGLEGINSVSRRNGIGVSAGVIQHISGLAVSWLFQGTGKGGSLKMPPVSG